MGIIKGHTDCLYHGEAQVKQVSIWSFHSSWKSKGSMWIVYLTCLIFSFYVELILAFWLFTSQHMHAHKDPHCHSTSAKTSICSPYLSCILYWPVFTYSRFKLTVQLCTWWRSYVLNTHKIRLDYIRFDFIVIAPIQVQGSEMHFGI